MGFFLVCFFFATDLSTARILHQAPGEWKLLAPKRLLLSSLLLLDSKWTPCLGKNNCSTADVLCAGAFKLNRLDFSCNLPCTSQPCRAQCKGRNKCEDFAHAEDFVPRRVVLLAPGGSTAVSALLQTLYLNGTLAKGHLSRQTGCPNPSMSLSHSPKGTWMTRSPVTSPRAADLLTVQLTALKSQHSRHSSELHPAAIPVSALEVFPCLWLAQPLNGVLGFFPR